MAGSAAPKLRKQPIPLARSILWKPTGGDAHAPSGAGDAIFVGQAALAALNDHLSAVPPPAGALGFFVGDLCEDPDIGARYLVIDSVVRLTQGVQGDHTGAVVGQIWQRVLEQVRSTKGQVLGWYHRHTPLGVELTPEDVETHLKYFDRSWHVALVLADAAGAPAAGFFRAGPDDSWTSTCLPFHELLQEESLRPGGKKRSFVTWRNYLPYNAAADRAGHGAAAPVPPPPVPPRQPTPPPPPRPRRLTPLPQMLPPLPEPEDEAPPEPLPEEECTDESAAPQPSPLRAPPPLRPPPRPPPAPGGDLPWLEEPSPVEPTPPPAPGVQPVGWEEQPQPEPEPEPEPPPEPVREPRPPWLGPALRRLGRVLWLPLRGVWALLCGVGRLVRRLARLLGRLVKFVLKLALIVAVLAAVGGTAYWWFFLRSPAKPAAPRAAPRVAPRAAAPAATQPTPGAPAPPSPPPTRSGSPFARLDAPGDAVLQAVRAYQDRAVGFAQHRIDCTELGRGLVSVEDRWKAYNGAKRVLGVTLDPAHAARDFSLYTAVDSVQRRFERTECPRP